MHLTNISEEIRRARKDRLREIQYERDHRDDFDLRFHHHHHHNRGPPRRWEDEHVREREIIYDSHGPVRGYLR